MANLKDLIVNGSARILGTIYGNLTGNVTGNCSGSSGSCTGNAATATKATQDANGNVITSTYVNLTGAQTISGAKTFSSTITGSVSGSAGSCTGTAAKATADASGNVITSTYATKTELSAKADSSSLATVATSGKYSDLTGQPTIPTVNNATLTIQKNGTNVQTFTANQSTDATANITVPTKVSELTNDSGFTTNTGTVTGIKMNGASKGTSGVVDLGTVITDVSGKQDKLAATGSASQPVYVSSAGTLSTCNTIPSTTASVTSGSTAALTSGGAYTALGNKQDKLTTAQQNAVDSGITSAKVSTYDGYATTKQDILTQDKSTLSSGTIALSTTYSFYSITPTEATTFTFSGAVSSKVTTFELEIIMNTVYTLTFPSSVKWLNDEAPDMSEAGTYYLVFRSTDGGTTWFANLQGHWS